MVSNVIVSIEVCADPVFVLGCPRSGTTALAKSLGSHPKLWASNETKFMSRLFAETNLDEIVAAEIERPTASWFRTNDVAGDEFVASIGLGINALLSSRSSGRRWVDHTPHYTPIAGLLARLFPGAKFLVIERDGRLVVESMLHFADRFPETERARIAASLPDYTRDMAEACRTWVAMVEAGESFATHAGDRCLVVRNHDLEREPVLGFEQILHFLDLPTDPGPAEAWQTKRFNSSFDPRDGQRVPRAHPWLTWTDDQRSVFDDISGATLRRLDYPAFPHDR